MTSTAIPASSLLARRDDPEIDQRPATSSSVVRASCGDVKFQLEVVGHSPKCLLEPRKHEHARDPVLRRLGIAPV